ncbi:hypothetical protein JCM10207_001716 [Rhodosporidiobolus poonsookiae]
MRLAFASTLVAVAASAVLAAPSWLPPLVAPAGGEVYKVGENITVSWDNTAFDEYVYNYGWFKLVYTLDDGTEKLAQYLGEGETGSRHGLWTQDNVLTFPIKYEGTEGLGEASWSVVEWIPVSTQAVPKYSAKFTVVAA